MLVRLRQILFAIVFLSLGFLVASGPFADWADDITNMASVAWSSEKAARGAGGTVPLLIAGFLMGQGIFLLGRRLFARLKSQKARRLDLLAAWDAAVGLGTRFGLHQYLRQCSNWALGDSSARIQTLALFKLSGIGRINDEVGSTVVTELLQRVAQELRAAALPDSASSFQRWLAHFWPSHPEATARGLPPPRYPARWSGSTFALAFRELDAVQATSIVREVATWIRREVSGISPSGTIEVCATIAIGAPDIPAREITRVAGNGVRNRANEQLTVYIEDSDSRAAAIEVMNGVRVERVRYTKDDTDKSSGETTTSLREQFVPILREWGPGVGCVVAASVFMFATGGKSVSTNTFPWPDNLTEVQLLEPTGARTVNLVRSAAATTTANAWTLSVTKLVQGRVGDGNYFPVQAHVKVTNFTDHTFYVSCRDFAMSDTDGATLPFDEFKTVRIQGGLTGKWLGPKESVAGWLVGTRRYASVTGLAFTPDRFSRLYTPLREP